MKLEQQVPRNALAWIILCLFTLVAPHAGRIPFWVLLVYLVAALWRIQIFRGRWRFPGRWVKLALIVSCATGIYLSFGSLIGLEPTVALLLTAFALKLTELVGRKDAYVLLFLGYFICITEFLFTQDLLIVLYSIGNVLLLTTALVALHQPGEQRLNRGSLRLAGIMLLQAFPLMVVLFFLFPRIGPLWTVPVKSHSAQTGMSDFLRPGDISQLSQSADVAFRAQFQGETPDFNQLYWRGLVMSRLDDGAWRSIPYYDVPAGERRPRPQERVGDPIDYSVIMEPTQQNWLYSLGYSISTQSGVMETADFRLYSPVIVEHETRYSVRSWPETRLEPELSAWRRSTELALPGDANPRARALAQELRGAVPDDREFVDSVLAYFTSNPFVYTLQPPLLPGDNPMDQFLFETRRGFCEHYAYAFVVMMRAAGVPARIVAGYMGGEVNPVNRTVIVHQFDAHAWTEVWLAGEGWVRVDPTAAVAPDRVEWGLERAVAGEGTFLADSPLSPLRYRRIDWINSLRLRYDALTYNWQAWVTSFNSEQQYQLLRNVFGDISARTFIAVLLGTWALVLVPVAGSLLLRRRRHRLAPEDRHYLAFCEQMARLGLVREPDETPGDFAARAVRKLPRLKRQILEITARYEALAYAPDTGIREQHGKQLRQAVRRLQFAR